MHLFDETAKIGISHRISQQLLDRLHQRSRVGRRMYGDYKTDISFVVIQETLLW